MIFGLSTFTTTSSPLFNIASWTWAKDAAAIGFDFISLNSSIEPLFFSSFCIIDNALSVSKGAQLFVRFCNSIMMSEVTISVRVDNS